ncbi:MAG TPA: hypothetical protein VNN55_03615 [bacterium]|nr:hypothetical protein [bacterium]
MRGPWIIFGLGGIDEIKGPAIELAGGKEWSIWHVGGRMIAGEELEFDLWGTDTGPNRSIFEIGPVVGAHYTRRPLKIYADVGLCYLSARFRESRPKQSGLGIPCEVGILLAPWHTWGFGLSGYATLNAITNYAGAQFVIRYGR